MVWKARRKEKGGRKEIRKQREKEEVKTRKDKGKEKGTKREEEGGGESKVKELRLKIIKLEKGRKKVIFMTERNRKEKRRQKGRRIKK